MRQPATGCNTVIHNRLGDTAERKAMEYRRNSAQLASSQRNSVELAACELRDGLGTELPQAIAVLVTGSPALQL